MRDLGYKMAFLANNVLQSKTKVSSNRICNFSNTIINSLAVKS